MTTRTVPAPPVNPENARFFAAAERGELLIGQCRACSKPHFYPRARCPSCLSDAVDWIAARGSGTLYAFSTLRRGTPVPYTLAYVRLDEEVTMLTNIVDADARTLAIGMRVRLVFKTTDGGPPVPMFTPDDSPAEETKR